MILCIYLYFNSLWELSAELGVSRTGRAPTPNGPRCYCSLTFHLIPHLFLLPVAFFFFEFFLLKFPKKKFKELNIYIKIKRSVGPTKQCFLSSDHFGRSIVLCLVIPFALYPFVLFLSHLLPYASSLIIHPFSLSCLLCFIITVIFFFWGYKYHQDLGKRKKKALIWDQS